MILVDLIQNKKERKKLSIKRTKLKDREMPIYSNGEEVFNMVSHIVGGILRNHCNHIM